MYFFFLSEVMVPMYIIFSYLQFKFTELSKLDEIRVMMGSSIG